LPERVHGVTKLSELEQIRAQFVRANPYDVRDRKDKDRVFQTMQAFVLRNGRSVRPTQLTRAERKYIRACIEARPTLGHAFPRDDAATVRAALLDFLVKRMRAPRLFTRW
jgi:hypothetical protein